MPQEVPCRAWYQGQESEGKAILSHEHLVFRGGIRLKIPLEDIDDIHSRDGRLIVQFQEEILEMDLGTRADRWCARIRSPVTRLDRLGIKPRHTVWASGLGDLAFLEELAAAGIQPGNTAGRYDMVFARADDEASLRLALGMITLLKPNGMLWILYPKSGRALPKQTVLEQGKVAGLSAPKVFRFSPTHGAVRFSRPR